MAEKEFLKISRKTFVNPTGWLGYDMLKEQTSTILSFLKAGVAPSKTGRTETFDEAIARLEIDPKDLKQTANTYLVYSAVFLGVAILDFFYGFYLLFYHGAFLGFVVAGSLLGLLLVQSFKYSFWSYQIKQRRLGCTFKEWRNSLFKSGTRP